MKLIKDCEDDQQESQIRQIIQVSGCGRQEVEIALNYSETYEELYHFLSEVNKDTEKIEFKVLTFSAKRTIREWSSHLSDKNSRGLIKQFYYRLKGSVRVGNADKVAAPKADIVR